MSTKIKLTYCGMAGEGATVKEAKQDAARRIESVLQLNYTPSVFTWKGRTGLVWNTPSGVCSGYLHEEENDGGNRWGLGGTCFHGPAETIAAACASMRYSLAQQGADIESDEIPAIIAKDKHAEREFRSWLGFQRAYKHRKESDSYSDNDIECHRYACEHAAEFAPNLK